MNKTTQKLLLAATVVTVLNFTSCGKYDDGPAFSLRTKKARLTGDWEVVRIGNQSFPSNGYALEMSLRDNGDLKFTYSYLQESFTYNGKWEFSGDKEDLLLTFDNELSRFKINRLTNKELWMETTGGGLIEEWRLEKK